MAFGGEVCHWEQALGFQNLRKFLVVSLSLSQACRSNEISQLLLQHYDYLHAVILHTMLLMKLSGTMIDQHARLSSNLHIMP